MKQFNFSEQEGIIGFWEQIGKYTVNVYLPESIDSMLTCILQDDMLIPPELRKPGTKVLFSARASDENPDLPEAALGGQKVVEILEMEKIEAM